MRGAVVEPGASVSVREAVALVDDSAGGRHSVALSTAPSVGAAGTDSAASAAVGVGTRCVSRGAFGGEWSDSSPVLSSSEEESDDGKVAASIAVPARPEHVTPSEREVLTSAGVWHSSRSPVGA